jgi:hypothetical protein
MESDTCFFASGSVRLDCAEASLSASKNANKKAGEGLFFGDNQTE